jgi:NAD/NADP transhydrogenase alpha subunit
MRRRSLFASTLGSLVLLVVGATLAFGANAFIAAFVAWGFAAVLAVSAWGLLGFPVSRRDIRPST